MALNQIKVEKAKTTSIESQTYIQQLIDEKSEMEDQVNVIKLCCLFHGKELRKKNVRLQDDFETKLMETQTKLKKANERLAMYDEYEKMIDASILEASNNRVSLV